MYCPRCHRTYEHEKRRHCPDDGSRLIDGPRIDSIRALATRQVGVILGERYVIRGFIGRGGMATVYLAEDLTNKEPVAVKILLPEFSRDARVRERFMREIEVAATIHHPHVIEVFDAGDRTDGTPYLILEYLHGESLGDLLRRDSRVEASFALPLVRAAALGLEAAHAKGIIHRDVKPDNLFLLGERGAPYSIKVLDFGMARLQEASRLSASGLTLGTLSYIAPEQALADPIDLRTDVYGLGMVLYRMIKGRLPFEAEQDAHLIGHQIFTPPPPLGSGRPALDRVVMNALRKHPSNRYPSMADMAHHLDLLLAGRDAEVESIPLLRPPDQYLPVTIAAKNAAAAFRMMLRG